MPRFLSVEWLDALAGAATSTHALREVADRRFAIEQTVRDTPEGDVTYHVVVEDGAHELGSRVAPDGGDETVVVAQWRGETPASLIARVAARVVALERSGKKVRQAVLLVGAHQNDQALAGRLQIARALLSRLLSSNGNELVLDAIGAPAAVRHELLSEVEALLDEFERPNVAIRLQFRRERPREQSGIHSAPGPVRDSRRSFASARPSCAAALGSHDER